MEKIILSVEGSCDMPKDLFERYGFKMIPAIVILGDDIVHDGEVSGEDLFAYFERTKKLPRTSCFNVQDFDQYFEKIAKEGDSIIHFSLSSGISATCAHAIESAAKMSEKLGKKITIIDTLSLSTGQSLLAIYAAKLVESGKYNYDQIVDMVRARVPYAQTSFATESVNYLAAGGRCPSVVAFAANVLKIRPQIIMKDGKLTSAKKYKGIMKKWVPQLIQDTLEENPNSDKEMVFLTYSSAPIEVLDAAEKQLRDYGFRNVYRATAGATISSHCGPNTLGVLYFCDGEHPIA